MSTCVKNPKQTRYDPPLKSVIKNNTIPEDAILEYDKEVIKAVDDVANVLHDYHQEGLIGKFIKFKKAKEHNKKFSEKLYAFDIMLFDENYKFAFLRLMNECILPTVAFKSLVPILEKHKIDMEKDWDNVK